jgi:hypothetical protein
MKEPKHTSIIRSVKSSLAAIVGVATAGACLYIYVAAAEEKPIAIYAGLLVFMGVSAYLIWKIVLAFRQYPGWCFVAAMLWCVIHYGYMHSDLTKEKFGLFFFSVAGGGVFVLVVSEAIRLIECGARKQGAIDERRRADVAASSLQKREEIPFGYRPEDL